MSLRCSRCEVDWPATPDYKTCPQCQQACSYLDHSAIDADEARSLRLHAEFDRFYDAREVERLRAELADREKPVP